MRLAPDGRGSGGHDLAVRLPGGELVPVEGIEDILGSLLAVGPTAVIVAKDVDAALIVRLCRHGAIRVVDLTTAKPKVFPCPEK